MSLSKNKNRSRAKDFKISFVLNEEFQQFKINAKQGQIYQARVINKIDNNHYLLLLNKQKIIAEFPEILPVGEKVIVKVNNIARRISLQFLGLTDDAFQYFRKNFPSKINFSEKDWHVLFTKWIEYNLPLEENSIKIYLQFIKYFKNNDIGLLGYIPEIWLLSKRWKLKPTGENVAAIIQLFKYTDSFSNPLKDLISFFIPVKNQQNSKSAISCLLFEKKMHKLKQDEIVALQKIFTAGSFAKSSREELLSLIFKSEGFLIFPDTEKQLRSIWIRRIQSEKGDAHFHLIVFSIIKESSLTMEIHYNNDFIRILIFISDVFLRNEIKENISGLENRVTESFGGNFVITVKTVELPELILFKHLNENHLQLKRVI